MGMYDESRDPLVNRQRAAPVVLDDKYGQFAPGSFVKDEQAKEKLAKIEQLKKSAVKEIKGMAPEKIATLQEQIDLFKGKGAPGGQTLDPAKDLKSAIVDQPLSADAKLKSATSETVMATNRAAPTQPQVPQAFPSSQDIPQVLSQARVPGAPPLVGSKDDIANHGQMPEYEIDAFKQLYDSILEEGTTEIPDWRPDWTVGKDKNGNKHTRDVDYDWAPLTQFLDDQDGGNLAQTVRRPMDADAKKIKLAEVSRAIAERRTKFGDTATENNHKMLKARIEAAKAAADADHKGGMLDVAKGNLEVNKDRAKTAKAALDQKIKDKDGKEKTIEQLIDGSGAWKRNANKKIVDRDFKKLGFENPGAFEAMIKAYAAEIISERKAQGKEVNYTEILNTAFNDVVSEKAKTVNVEGPEKTFGAGLLDKIFEMKQKPKVDNGMSKGQQG